MCFSPKGGNKSYSFPPREWRRGSLIEPGAISIVGKNWRRARRRGTGRHPESQNSLILFIPILFIVSTWFEPQPWSNSQTNSLQSFPPSFTRISLNLIWEPNKYCIISDKLETTDVRCGFPINWDCRLGDRRCMFCSAMYSGSFPNALFQVGTLLADFQMQFSFGVGWLHWYWIFLVTRYVKELFWSPGVSENIFLSFSTQWTTDL